MTKKGSKDRLKYDILGVSLIVIGLYFYICLLGGDSGLAGKYFKRILMGVFGLGAYLFPLFLIVSGLGIFYLKDNIKLNIKFYSICLVFINLLILLHLLNIKVFEYVSVSYWNNLINAYNLGAERIGGGILGASIGYFLIKYIGKAGTIAIITGVFMISFILFANVSAGSMINGLKIFLVKLLKPLGSYKNPFCKIKKLRYNKTETIQEDKAPIDPTIINENRKVKIVNFTKEFDNSFVEKAKKVKVKTEPITTIYPHDDNKPIENIKLENKPLSSYVLPDTNLLFTAQAGKSANVKKEVMHNIKILNETLKSFSVNANVAQVSVGPSITRYELQLNPGVKVSKVVNLADDLALSLATQGIRIEAPIPGKAAVGIEVPNKEVTTVYFKEVIESKEFKNHKSKIAFALGRDVAGTNIVADISKMPHLLIAGATGAGKSVCINSIISSILYKAYPDEVKMLLIDPKVVELSTYNGIPHLLIPVVTDPKKAAGALNWAVQEMTERYKRFAAENVRDIDSYNRITKERNSRLPQIVIIIDELSDLMMVAPGEVEDAICRLAQMARAAGIYLIIATQRPSVDVITGLIKANIPSRISFAVSSQIDSRTILDMGGAEKLLGKGDMLFFPAGKNKPKRVQGTFISDKEIQSLVSFIKKQVSPNYDEEIINNIKEEVKIKDDETDELMKDAVELVLEAGQASISMLQRHLRIGYNRAARIIDQMEERRIIGGHEGSKPRKVLLSKEEWREMT